MSKILATWLSIIYLIGSIPANQMESKNNELPECIVITHCVREDIKVTDVNSYFKKAVAVVSTTPRNKIIEQNNLYLHAEAKTKWMKYTDDFLVKGIPEKSIIQVRSESRVGIGDNGVNRKRVDKFKFRLMSHQS